MAAKATALRTKCCNKIECVNKIWAYRCTKCNYWTDFNSTMNRHIVACNGETPYACPNDPCPYAAATKTSLRKHVNKACPYRVSSADSTSNSQNQAVANTYNSVVNPVVVVGSINVNANAAIGMNTVNTKYKALFKGHAGYRGKQRRKMYTLMDYHEFVSTQKRKRKYKKKKKKKDKTKSRRETVSRATNETTVVTSNEIKNKNSNNQHCNTNTHHNSHNSHNNNNSYYGDVTHHIHHHHHYQ
eukprot:253897_1